MDIVHAEKYYDKIKERYPELSEKQIDKIITHGLRSLYGYNKGGGDVFIRSPYYVAYFGKLFRDLLTFRRYSQIKHRIKLRGKYVQKKKIFNGHYYIGFTEAQHNEGKKQFHHMGRRRQMGHFGDIILLKIQEECQLFGYKYIYEIDYPEDLGFSYKMTNFSTRNFRLVAIKNSEGEYEPVSSTK